MSRDAGGRTTRARSRRIVHAGRRALAVKDAEIEAEDNDGNLRIHSGVDGRALNTKIAPPSKTQRFDVVRRAASASLAYLEAVTRTQRRRVGVAPPSGRI